MFLLKSLNNNIALVKDSNSEYIVMGKGIAFNKKVGSLIDSNLIEKKYVLEDKKINEFENLMQRISIHDLELSSQIIINAERELGYSCNEFLLMSLADHLSLVFKRAKDNLYFESPLEWDIKLIYPKEYKFALETLEKINKKRNLNLPKQEASFIALHIINSNTNQKDMNETILTTKIIQNILNIVRNYYKKHLDESNFDVSRFIIHIRYFVRRQINGDILNADTSFIDIITQKYPKDYECALMISNFLEKQYDWIVTNSEKLYLTLHLNRMNYCE